MNTPSNYQGYEGYHSWNQVWIPSQNQWVTVDTTWHMFNCGSYVNSTRHSFSVQATLWNPKENYLSYFKNDPEMAWYHTGEVWNDSLYYDFNLSNEPQFRNLFKGVIPSSITFKNQWGWNSGTITFDGANNSFQVNGTNYNADGTVSLSLIDLTTGTVLFKDSINGNQNVNNLASELENQHYKIGNIIELTTSSEGSKSFSVIGNGKTISNNNNLQMFKITENGLVPFNFNKTIKANVIAKADLNGGNIYSAEISGTVKANTTVTIEVNGESFNTKSNGKGNFKINIETKAPINEDSNFYITSWGENQLVTKSKIVKEAELSDSKIVINNVWSFNLGAIGFDSKNMKLTNQLGWYETNPYLSSKAEAFSITMNSAKGKTLESLKAMGSDSIPAKIEKLFNGKSFNYGDSITIDYKTSAKLTVTNVWINGKFEKSYPVKSNITLYLTPKGLPTTK